MMASFSLVLLLGAAAGSALLGQSTKPGAYRVLAFGLAAYRSYLGLVQLVVTVRSLTQQMEHTLTLKLFSWLTGYNEPPQI